MPKTSTRRAFLRRHAAIAAGVATIALVAGPVVTAVARDAPFIARIKGEPRSARPLDIKSAAATFDRAGAPAVKVTLTPASAKVFGDLTRRNVGKEMELLYGGKVLISAVIQAPITGGTVLVTGRYTIAQTKALANQLMAN